MFAHWITLFLCLVSEGKSEALMAGIDCWKVIERRSSRVWEHTMRFLRAYMTNPPRHELVGSCALNSGRKFWSSTVTTQGMSSLPSRAWTWLSMEDLYSWTASLITPDRTLTSLYLQRRVTFGSMSLIRPCTSKFLSRSAYSCWLFMSLSAI